MVQKQVNKALKKKKKRTKELRAFENMSNSDSGQDLTNSKSSEEGEV